MEKGWPQEKQGTRDKMRAGLEKQDLELGVVAQASLIAVRGRRRVRGHSELQARQPGLHSETFAPKTDRQASKQTNKKTKQKKERYGTDEESRYVGQREKAGLEERIADRCENRN